MNISAAQSFLRQACGADKFSGAQCADLLIKAQRLVDLFGNIDLPGCVKALPYEPEYETILALKMIKG